MNTKYIDEFLRLKCVSDLIERDFFKGTKEISESMAAISAIRLVVDTQTFKNPSVKLVDLGCGSHPSTAGLASFITRWESVAIDPRLPKKYWNVARFSTGRGNVKDYRFVSDGLIIIVAIDPRLSVNDILDMTECPEVVLVTLTQPDSDYLDRCPPSLFSIDDEGILSVFSRVSVWHLEGERKWREREQ